MNRKIASLRKYRFMRSCCDVTGDRLERFGARTPAGDGSEDVDLGGLPGLFFRSKCERTGSSYSVSVSVISSNSGAVSPSVMPGVDSDDSAAEEIESVADETESERLCVGFVSSVVASGVARGVFGRVRVRTSGVRWARSLRWPYMRSMSRHTVS